MTATDSELVRQRVASLPPLQALDVLGLTAALAQGETLEELHVFSNHLRLDIASDGGINFRLLRAAKQLGVEFIKVQAICATLDAHHESYFHQGRRPTRSELESLIRHYLPQDKLETLIANGELRAIAELLQQGLDPNTPVGDEPLLHYAVQQGDLKLLTLLLEQGADMARPDSKGRDLMEHLFALADKKLTPAIRLLLSHGWPVDKLLADGGSVLWHAFALDYELASMLHRAGLPYIRSRSAYQGSAIEQHIKRAISHHDQPVLERLLLPLSLNHDQLMVLAGLCTQVDNLVGFKHLESLGLSLDGHGDDMVELLQGAASSGAFRLVAYLLLKAEALNLNIDDCAADLVEYLVADDRASRLIAIITRRITEFDHNRAIGTAIHHNALNNLSILLKANKPTHYRTPLLHDYLDELTPEAARMLLAAGENPAETNFDGETVFEAMLRLRPGDKALHQVFHDALFDLPVSEHIWLLIALKDTIAFERSWLKLRDKQMVNHQGDTLLLNACRHGASDIVAFLLTKEQDVNQLNHEGNSALALSIINGQLITARALLNAGADANDTLRVPKQYVSGSHKSLEVLLGPLSRLKHEAEALREPLRPAGRQPLLSWAVFLGQRALVELLLAKGARVNARDHDGASALYFAVANGHGELLELLLASGADARDWRAGQSLLHTACYRGHAHLIAPLLKAELALNAANETDGDTPLHIAASMGAMHDDELLPVLLEAGADINAQNNQGRTPLMNAVRMLNHKGVATLLQAGADVTLLDKRSRSAYDHYQALGIPGPGLDENALKPSGFWYRLHKLTLGLGHVTLWYLLPGLCAALLVWYLAPDWIWFGGGAIGCWWLVSLVLGLKQQLASQSAPPQLLSPLGNFSRDEDEIRYMASWDDPAADVPLSSPRLQA
ncbi:ankyrin repeat domain-containing protein [Shewanella sp. JM162201]|uniref:Ankyrin repeat domain-containing protein n=1 Tax=Shewanella jiangmenensis TaxID=2837387 RepID=A0ABS5V3E9_9GAMM|nr:ankyrin repeat domain-containing protein [Shewanella jiangmenensis]MBT1444341.1 ankyrin repeat domain-containing protein [Shewanella jiangmenensis]